MVAVALLISPIVASAQSTTDDSALIAQLTALIATLTQELQQLISMHATGSLSQHTGKNGVMIQTLTATCQGHPYTNGVNGISWGSYPIGGTGSYTYHWTLSNDVTGTGIGGDSSDLLQQNLLATYGSAGLKSAQVAISDGVNTVTTGCSVSVGSGASVDSASIDSSSQTQTSNSFTITGSSSGIVPYDGIIVYIVPSSYRAYSNDYSSIAGQLGKTGFYKSNSVGTKTSGQWTASFSYVDNGSYFILVYEAQTKVLLARATISVNGTTSLQPSATIDQSSLTSNSGYPVITGSASNVSSVYVYISSSNEGGGSLVPVVNGRWNSGVVYAKAETNGFPAGSYTVTVYGNEMYGPILTTGTLTVQSLQMQAQIQNLLNQINRH